MKLNRALAEKNRLARKLKDIQTKISTHNSYIKGNDAVYNVDELITNLENSMNDLINIKVKIAQANSEIVEKVYKLSELKSYASFLKNLQIKEGKVQEERWNSEVQEWECEMGNKERDILLEKVEIEIQDIQSEMERFNFEKDI